MQQLEFLLEPGSMTTLVLCQHCSVMSTLHWLPIKHRIDFKILLITYKDYKANSCRIIVLHVRYDLKTLAI